MRRDGDIAARNQKTDQTTDAEKKQRTLQGRARLPFLLRCAAIPQQGHENSQRQRQCTETPAPAHKPGKQEHVFRSSQRIGKINQWRNKYADQTNKQNHQHDARARHQLQARLSRKPKPTHQHQQCVSKLQYMAATPEQ